MARILAVDDDPVARRFYEALLQEDGHEVKVAGDATAAIIVCEDFQPDLLLLDWEMPGGGGAMVVSKLFEMLSKNLPVLFISGFPEKVTFAVSGVRFGILKKPTTVTEILAEVGRLLSPP